MDFGRKFLEKVRRASLSEDQIDQNAQEAVEPAWDFLDDQFALEEFESLPGHSSSARFYSFAPEDDIPHARQNLTPAAQRFSPETSRKCDPDNGESIGFFRDLWKRYNAISKPRWFDEGSDNLRTPEGSKFPSASPSHRKLKPKGSLNEGRLGPNRAKTSEISSNKSRAVPVLRRCSSESGGAVGSPETALELTQSGSWKGDADKIKGKLKAAWNNVRYGWTIKHRSSFDDESPIWLLGKLYDARIDSERFADGKLTAAELMDSADFHDFIADFTSKIWLTYRTGFENLSGSQIYSDTGWGCMLRTGQMFLAQALILHLLGRDWTVFDAQTYDTIRAHRDIIRYFGDSPSCPLSLHNMVHYGTSDHGKTLGDWYGPGSTALVLRDIMRSEGALSDPILSQLTVYVAQDNTVCLEEIEKLCTQEQDLIHSAADLELERMVKIESVRHVGRSSNDTECVEATPEAGAFVEDVTAAYDWTKSLILIVPLRLGTEHLNPIYVQHLRMVLAMRHCLGIIGGRPKHSMYFVGWHSRYWIYLDPHYCQDFLDSTGQDFSIKSFHCRWPKKLEIEDMDPSCAVGFYCRNREALDRLLEDLAPVIENSHFPKQSEYQAAGSQVRYPLFSVVSSRAAINKVLETRTNPAQRLTANGQFSDRYKMDHIEQQRLASAAHSHGFELL